MQHPSNRIVMRVDYPVLYLIEAYKITSDVGIDNPLSTNYEITVLDKEKMSSLVQGNIRVPKKYPFSDYSQHETQMNAENNKLWDLNMIKKGFVVRDLKTNIRTKFIATNYKTIQDLKLIFQIWGLYLKLRKTIHLASIFNIFQNMMNYFRIISICYQIIHIAYIRFTRTVTYQK